MLTINNMKKLTIILVILLGTPTFIFLVSPNVFIETIENGLIGESPSDIKKTVETNHINNKKILITYSVDDLLELENADIPIEALNTAINIWERKNNLKFIESDNDPNIIIEWSYRLSDTHLGVASCYEFIHITQIDCTLTISLGKYDCENSFIQTDVDSVTNTIMHEIGHSLGLSHISDKSHLMYDIDGSNQIDTLGYYIPDRLTSMERQSKIICVGY